MNRPEARRGIAIFGRAGHREYREGTLVRFFATVCVVTFVCGWFAPDPAWSAIARGTSAVGAADVVAPTISILLPEEDELYYSSDTALFFWNTHDVNPGQDPYDYFARVLVADQVLAVHEYGDHPQEAHWWWTVPEIATGSATLEINATDAFGNKTIAYSPTFTILILGTPSPAVTPSQTRLLPPHPNPCNPATEIICELPQASRAELSIYDLRGRHVRHLLSGDLAAGRHSVIWRGRDDAGRPAPAGIYAVVMRTDTGVRQVQKVVLIP